MSGNQVVGGAPTKEEPPRQVVSAIVDLHRNVEKVAQAISRLSVRLQPVTSDMPPSDRARTTLDALCPTAMKIEEANVCLYDFVELIDRLEVCVQV